MFESSGHTMLSSSVNLTKRRKSTVRSEFEPFLTTTTVKGTTNKGDIDKAIDKVDLRRVETTSKVAFCFCHFATERFDSNFFIGIKIIKNKNLVLLMNPFYIFIPKRFRDKWILSQWQIQTRMLRVYVCVCFCCLDD